MNIVTIHQAKTHLSRLIRMVLRGEEVVIAKGKKPLVKLEPVSRVSGLRPIGDFKGKISLAKDFDRPLSDFDEYQ